MDIRKPVMAVLCGGSPSPGMNGVISAVAIEALNNGCDVIGIYDGFKHIMQGLSEFVIEFSIADVSSLQHRAGSKLRTSKNQLNTADEVDNVLRVLQHLRIDYFVTVGGTRTAHSAYLVSKAAEEQSYPLQLVHVPKTIFNDLPLPTDSVTFGFSTARDYGMELVNNLRVDAKMLSRYYFITCMGQQAGHLALGIGKSAAATAILIPEEFEDGFSFQQLVDLVEALIVKRLISQRHYGVIILNEGLVNKMEQKDVEDLFGSVDNGHQGLGKLLSERVSGNLLQNYGIDIQCSNRYIGAELRSAPPNAADMELARDLGFAACRFVLEGGSGALVVLKDDELYPINLEDIVDVETGKTQIRYVSLEGTSYKVARKYQIRLKASDIRSSTFHYLLQQRLDIDAEAFCEKYAYIAEDDE